MELPVCRPLCFCCITLSAPSGSQNFAHPRSLQGKAPRSIRVCPPGTLTTVLRIQPCLLLPPCCPPKITHMQKNLPHSFRQWPTVQNAGLQTGQGDTNRGWGGGTGSQRMPLWDWLYLCMDTCICAPAARQSGPEQEDLLCSTGRQTKPASCRCGCLYALQWGKWLGQLCAWLGASAQGSVTCGQDVSIWRRFSLPFLACLAYQGPDKVVAIR